MAFNPDSLSSQEDLKSIQKTPQNCLEALKKKSGEVLSDIILFTSVLLFANQVSLIFNYSINVYLGEFSSEKVIEQTPEYKILLEDLNVILKTYSPDNPEITRKLTLIFKFIKEKDPELYQSYQQKFPNGIQIIDFNKEGNETIGMAPVGKSDTIFLNFSRMSANPENTLDYYIMSIVHELSHQIRVKELYGQNIIIDRVPFPNSDLRTPNFGETDAVQRTNKFLRKAGLLPVDYKGNIIK